MRFLVAALFLLSSLYAVSNPYRNISDSDKINALMEHFIKEEIGKLPKPPKKLDLKKDMFETTAQFNQRVEKVKKESDKRIKEYKAKVADVKRFAKGKALKKALAIVYGVPQKGEITYDADTQHFFTSLKLGSKTQKIGVKVPINIAKSFYNEYKKIDPVAVYEQKDGSLALKTINFSYRGKNYEALFTDKNFAKKAATVTLKSDYDINSQIESSITIAASDDPEIKRLNEAILNAKRSNANANERARLEAQLAKLQQREKAFVDDLPALLKRAKQAKTDRKKWLFIVGIEEYSFTENISFAKRSALMFKKVAKKALGVPESNCFTLIDNKATLGSVKNRLKKMLRKVQKGDTIYFYYNGHGIPIPNKENEPFMLAHDIEPDFAGDDSFFSLKNIYKTLSDSRAKKIVAVVDSCFSGGADGKTLLKGVAAARVGAKKVKFDNSKMAVLTAGKGTEYSNAYDKKGHRLFSYYVMKSILEGKRDIASIHKTVFKNVKETSFREYGDLRVQHPTREGNGRLKL